METRKAGSKATTTTTQPPQGTTTSGPFTFSSVPRPLDPSRPKYRPNATTTSTQQTTTTGENNGIMEDYRVRRESLIPLLRGTEKLTLPSLSAIAAARRSKQTTPNVTNPNATPPQGGTKAAKSNTAVITEEGPGPIAGRQHCTVQTEAYLEELAERPRETTAETQTDAFLDRPPSPLFVPRKTGVDKECQVDSQELFDFDAEVEPLLETLVGRTLDQAMTELVEEEEMKALQERQEDFGRRRAAENAEVQRLEENERRRNEEKQRRLLQEQKREEQERQEKIEAKKREDARKGVADVTKALYARLKAEGFFRDRVERDVSTNFIPWLRNAVNLKMNDAAVGREVLRRILAHTLARSATKYQQQKQDDK